MARKIRQKSEAIQAAGEKVTWINRASSDSYRRLKVAPVQQNSEILLRDGKITCRANYCPAHKIAEIEPACVPPDGQGVLLNNQLCGQFSVQVIVQGVTREGD